MEEVEVSTQNFANKVIYLTGVNFANDKAEEIRVVSEISRELERNEGYVCRPWFQLLSGKILQATTNLH